MGIRRVRWCYYYMAMNLVTFMLTSSWPWGNDGMIWTLPVLICVASSPSRSHHNPREREFLVMSGPRQTHFYLHWTCCGLTTLETLDFVCLHDSLCSAPPILLNISGSSFTLSPLWGHSHFPRSLGPHLASFFLSFWSQIECYLLRATSSSYSFLWFCVVIVYRVTLWSIWRKNSIYMTWLSFCSILETISATWNSSLAS